MASDEVPYKPSIWSWPDATLGQRAAAFVLDGLIVAAFGSLLQVLTERVIDGPALFGLQAALAMVYFVAMQAAGRRTLGQSVVGIRLVSLRERGIDDGVPLLALVLREVLWFPLSVAFLGAGVIVMCLRRDRMSLYDLLARTRMVAMSRDPGPASVRIGLVMGVVAVVGVVSMLAIHGVSRWTVLPIRRLAHDLELLGYKVGRISGSQATGFKIESLAFESEEVQCELSGVRFAYDPPGDGRGPASIRDLTVEDAKIFVHEMPSGFQATLPTVKWLIESAEVRRLALQLPDHAPFKVSRFFLGKVAVDSANKTLRLSRLWLESDALWVDLRDVFLQSDALAVGATSRVQVRPGFFPGLLLAPVDVSFEGALIDGRVARLKLEAFEGRVKIEARSGSGALKIAGFSPSSFFNTEMPLADLNLHASGNFLDGEIREAVGFAVIGPQRFTVGPDGLYLSRGKRHYRIVPNRAFRWREWLAGKTPAAKLFSDDEGGVASHLAEIYYSRPPARLSTGELERIKREQVFFESGPALETVRAPSALKPETR